MTPNSIKPIVGRYLGIQDISRDTQYEATYLPACNEANRYVAQKIAYPLKSDGPVGTTDLAYPGDYGLTTTLAIQHPDYGHYVLSVKTLDEAVRSFEQVGTNKPLYAVLDFAAIKVLPVPAVACVYTHVYVPTLPDLATADTAMLLGKANMFPHLMALRVAINLLRGDALAENWQRAAALEPEFEAQRIETIRLLHRNSSDAEVIRNLLLPPGTVKQ